MGYWPTKFNFYSATTVQFQTVPAAIKITPETKKSPMGTNAIKKKELLMIRTKASLVFDPLTGSEADS